MRSARSAKTLTTLRSLLLMAVSLCLSSCDDWGGSGGSARARLDEDRRSQSLVVVPRPPILVARDEAEIADTVNETAAIDDAFYATRFGARRLQADSLAWLSGAPIGRAFLALPAPRVLARGEPAAECPALGLAGGDETTPDRETAADLALAQCLAALPEGRDCGCRIVAVDGLLTVPLSEMAYATGVATWLRAPALGLDAVLVAEEDPDGTVLLRDLRGPVAKLERLGPGRVALAFVGDGPRLEGRSEPVGFRRGRIAERLYLEGADGARAVVLIGLSPAEIADESDPLAWKAPG